MNHLINLKTAKFNVLQEDENPNNQIYGQSVLLWIKDQLENELEFSEVGSEDWGWYCDIKFKNRNYMLGATAFFEEGDDQNAELEWIFQIEKHRSFKEIILFQEKMNTKDVCLQYFKNFFDTTNNITVISVERNA